jgi:hypothetical protein
MATRRCKTCDRQFEGRADASFCSPACRQRGYRDRKQRPDVSAATLSERLAELDRLSGELHDALAAYMAPNYDRSYGKITFLPHSKAVPIDIDDRDARLARRAADNLTHICNYLTAIRNASHNSRAPTGTGTGTGGVVDLDD